MNETTRSFPPIWHDDGTVTLWHPSSPGVRIRLRPNRFRRLFTPREPFATLGEVLRHYRRRDRD